MPEEQNSEAVESTPTEAQSETVESLEANSTDNGTTNDSTGEGESSQSRREQRADFFKQKEKLEKEYQEKVNQLQEVPYQEGEGSTGQVASSDQLQNLIRETNLNTLDNLGVTNAEDQEQVMEIMNAKGMTAREVVGISWVQNMLKDNANVRRNTAATPGASKRSGQVSAKETVGYWLNRSDLPPKDNKELRRQVIHARNNAQKRDQMFNN